MKSYKLNANPKVTVRAARIVSIVLVNDKDGNNNGASILTEDGEVISVGATYVHLFSPKVGAFCIFQKVGSILYSGPRNFFKDFSAA